MPCWSAVGSDSATPPFGTSAGDSLAEDASEVRIMFNNNRSADAPTAARRFRELVGQDPGPAPAQAQGKLL